MHVLDRTAATRALRRRLRPLGAVMALVTLAACGGGGGGGAQPRPSPLATTFIDLVAALPSDLDPAAAEAPGFAALETSLAGTLVRPVGVAPGAATLAAPQRVSAYLARSWTALPGGGYVFRLRAGVLSAFGHTLSASDVRFSFERELALSAMARSFARLAGIDVSDPITVLGPLTVRLNATGAGGLALAVLAGFRFGILDRRAVTAHATAADPRAHGWLERHLAFYGAYRLVSFSPGVRLLLIASPRWWTAPAFRHVAVEADPSAPLRLAEVGAREASHTSQLDPATFAAATRTNGVAARLEPSTTVAALVPNQRLAPLAVAAVRRALSLALDRGAIARGAFGGIARPALSPIPSTIPLEPGVVAPTFRHDLARARSLLAAGGYPRGFRLTIAGARADGPQTAAELALIARQLRPLGIAVTTRTVATEGALAVLMRSGAAGSALVVSAAPIASVAGQLAACCLPGSPLAALGGGADPALAALAATAARGGAVQRRSAAHEALAALAATVPEIPLVEIPSQDVTLTSIGGYAAYAAQGTYYDRLRS